MPNIISEKTIGQTLYIVSDINPSTGSGISAPIGSICSSKDGSGLYVKIGNSNTAWSLSTQRGVLAQLSNTGYPALPYDKLNALVIDSNNRYMYAVVSVGTTPNAGAISVYDIANPLNPILITTFGCNSVSVFQPLSITMNGNYLYVGTATGHLWIIDVTIPSNPVTAGQILSGALNQKLYNIDYLISGTNSYVVAAHQTTGLNIFQVTNPYSASLIYNQTASLATKASGIAVNGSNCFVVYYTASAPYTIDNVTNWNLTTPTSPAIGLSQTIAGATKITSIVIDKDYNLGFVTESISGNVVYVLDISTPSSMTLLSTITMSNPSTPNQTIEQPLVIDSNKRLIYINNSGGSTRYGAIEVWNISNPSYPFKVNSIGNFSATSSQSITGMCLQNNTLYISSRNTRSIFAYNTY
jgi:hypothetical protein